VSIQIWTDDYLNQLQEDAQHYILNEIKCLFHKFYLPITEGQSVYTLPSKVKGVIRVTWLGRQLEPLSWDELTIITPATVVVNNSTKIETSISRPQWYAMHPTNLMDIRLYPTPDETFDQSPTTDNPYAVQYNEPHCNISCWRYIDDTGADPTAQLPLYILRRTVKAYVLWRAFAKEGIGQNLTASKYYKQKLDFLIDNFRLINDGTFVSKKYSLGDGDNGLESFRYPKPIYPANFERVLF
jgi:hypothetical protein